MDLQDHRANQRFIATIASSTPEAHDRYHVRFQAQRARLEEKLGRLTAMSATSALAATLAKHPAWDISIASANAVAEESKETEEKLKQVKYDLQRTVLLEQMLVMLIFKRT